MNTSPPPPENILVADDDMGLAPRIVSALSAKGYNVIVTPELSRAKAQLRRWQLDDPDRFEYAAVIIDMDFPDDEGMAGPHPNDLGMEVFKEALLDPFLEAIIATAFPKIETAIRAANEGSFRYLVKDEHFIGRLVYTVDTAVAMRRSLVGIYTKLGKLRKIHGVLGATGAPKAEIEKAQDLVRVLEQHFMALLRSRGKEPPAGF